MTIIQRLVVCVALALGLLSLLPTHSFSAEVGRPVAGRDARRGAEVDERRRIEEGRRDDSRASAVEATGRRTDLTRKQNAEFHDADALAKEMKAEEKKVDNSRSDGPKDLETLQNTRKLSRGEIEKLQSDGVDIHDLKGNDSTLDLYKNKNGEVYIGNKDGTGSGQATGYNTRK